VNKDKKSIFGNISKYTLVGKSTWFFKQLAFKAVYNFEWLLRETPSYRYFWACQFYFAMKIISYNVNGIRAAISKGSSVGCNKPTPM
jgi:hypothetical protein